jgi:four helix bundle protein
MFKTTRVNYYDLENRTLEFADRLRKFVKAIPYSVANIEDTKQVVRSSGSVGANYIEANESLSKKDFIFRIKISRKEAKESRFWLKLIDEGNKEDLKIEKQWLINESMEFMKIFGSIITKSEKNNKQ